MTHDQSISREVRDRHDRARDLDYGVYDVSKNSDYSILEIDAGEDTYTVIPGDGYCSCPDARFRNNVCKHCHYLVRRPDGVPPFVADRLREAIAETAESYVERYQNIKDDLEDARDLATHWRETQRLLNESDSADDTRDSSWSDEEIDEFLAEIEASEKLTEKSPSDTRTPVAFETNVLDAITADAHLE